MAEDANVSQVDELRAFAGKIHGFMESTSDNCTALCNIMVQKLDGLRKKLKKAEEMEHEALAEYNALLSDIAMASNDYQRRIALLAKKSYIENRKLKAQRMRDIIARQVVVAQGAAMAIIDGTKVFQNRLNQNVHNGQRFIKKSVGQLEQYFEANKKI